MDEKNTVEHFIMLVLKRFVAMHIGLNLSSVDAIIVDYVVSVLEDVGTDLDELETSFELQDFIEMMSAYIPGFDQIENSLVTEWILSVATKIQSGTWVEDCVAMESEASLETSHVSDQNNNAKSEVGSRKSKAIADKPGGDWFSTPTISSSVLFPEPGSGTDNLFPPLAALKGDDLFPSTEESSAGADSSARKDFVLEFPGSTDGHTKKRNSRKKGPKGQRGLLPTPGEEAPPRETRDFENNQPLQEEMFPAFEKGLLKREKVKEKTSYALADEAEAALKVKYSEKVECLMEMFPDIPECQLKRCLSKAKSNVEKAVATILANRNDGTKIAVAKEKEKEESESAANCAVDEEAERDIRRLMEMFPRLSECRIRDRYYIVGGNSERAMRVILSEEESRARGYQGNRFQVHEVSFKKKDLSEQDENALKREISKKYSYVVDDPEKEHRPVVLVRKDLSTNKVSDLCGSDNNVDNSNSNCMACISTESKVEAKQSNNPKLNKKHRYR